MTKEEIIAGNKLIAEFMKKGKIHPNDLKYHSSWDWLMPVVEKIEQRFIDNQDAESGFSIRIEAYLCVIEGMLGNQISEGFEDKKILSVWKAIVDFIEWYNSQPQTTQP